MQKFGIKIFFLLCLCCLQLVLRSPEARALVIGNLAPSQLEVWTNLRPESSLTCALRPVQVQGSSTAVDPRPEDFSPTRFRQGLVLNTVSSNNNEPQERIATANPTNYGDRFSFDIYGQRGDRPPIVVLHETVATINQTINFFQTPHFDEDEQASYHTLISLLGEIIYLVPPDKRAFGAGDSVFDGRDGEETVQTNPNFPPSVNNFAYHISLESPEDGLNGNLIHSGYTEEQYRSLAWLIAKTGVPEDRITTHRQADRSGLRIDPRSFDYDYFLSLYRSAPKNQEISIGCTVPKVNP